MRAYELSLFLTERTPWVSTQIRGSIQLKQWIRFSDPTAGSSGTSSKPNELGVPVLPVSSNIGGLGASVLPSHPQYGVASPVHLVQSGSGMAPVSNPYMFSSAHLPAAMDPGEQMRGMMQTLLQQTLQEQAVAHEKNMREQAAAHQKALQEQAAAHAQRIEEQQKEIDSLKQLVHDHVSAPTAPKTETW